MDLSVSAVQDGFDQPVYVMYRNLEDLLLNASGDHQYEVDLQEVYLFYDELGASQLDVELKNLATHFTVTSVVNLLEIIEYLKGFFICYQKVFP